MDAAGALALVEFAEEARAALRRQEPGASAEVERRYPDLLTALGWYVAEGRAEDAYRLARALSPFWMTTNRIQDGDDWFGRLLSDGRLDERSRARALYDHGYLIFWAGRYDVATARFNQARDAARALGDRTVQALALAGMARVALNDDVAAAIQLLREAMAVTEDVAGDDEGRDNAQHVLGVALQMSGDFAGAREVMTTRLRAAQDRGDTFAVWSESANLGMVERQLGNVDRAEELVLQALATDIAQRSDLFTAWTLNGLAAVTAARGVSERAAVPLGIARSRLSEAGGEWPPDERAQYDETLSSLTEDLGDDAVTQLMATGAAMTMEDALTFAFARD